ncbi:MAG TPA: efflux RND transporter permease subunit [Bryobacteraceae bacterium]|nr:efflux RND transporter permease subunit [Bryobacteraceae bacterium]
MSLTNTSAPNLSRIFIERPIMTALVMFAIALFGVVGYRALPVAALPSVDYPTIQVSASLPGADPETMASAVATPLERQFSTIAGIDSMSSSNSQGSTNISVQFELSRNIDAAAQDIQAAIAAAGGLLPPDMPHPPTYQKVNPAEQPIMYLALYSTTLPPSQVDEYAETVMAQRISMSSGVSQVQVFGGQKYAVRVNLNPDALNALGVGIDDVQRAIQASNVNLPTGKLYGNKQAFTIHTLGQLTNAAAYRPLIVAWRNGVPVRLDQVAEVADGVETERVAAWMNGQRSVVLAIRRQPGSNTVQVADNVKALMPVFKAEMPPAMKLEIIYDASESVRESIDDVKFTLALTICMVVLVIALFLRNLSATIIPGVAVPLSIIGTCAVMYLLGYSLNNLSLMALTLSVGFVVDDAIVMLENIVRYVELGKSRREAALLASREIGFTIVSMTISLVSVFIPVLFMGGIVGRLLHEFSVTIAVAILISGFVSLTLTPMLGSRYLRYRHGARHGLAYRALEGGFNAMTRAYDRSLLFVLRYRFATLLLAFALLGGTVYLFRIMPTGFIPSQDSGVIYGPTIAGQDISFLSLAKHQRAVADIMQRDPAIDSVFAYAGDGNTGIVYATLKPRKQRALSVDQVIAELRPKLFSVPGILAFLQNPPPITITGQNSNSVYQLTLQSANLEEIYKWVPLLMNRMRTLPGFVDVNSDMQIQSPQVKVAIDRDRALSLGVTPAQIEGALAAAYGDQQVSTIFTPSNQYQVITEVERRYQADPADLSKLYVHSAQGPLVPLESVVRITRGAGPLSVNHFGQLPAVTISFNLTPGFSLGQAADRVNQVIQELRMPPTLSATFQGTVKEFQKSFRGMTVLLLLAVLVIYIILGILYESFIHPITILSGLPSAVFGALLTLKLFHKDLDLFAFVGLIMLIGVVKKNAIMMIDFALEAQRIEGKDPRHAIYQGCLLRFRPIMMTTVAALCGTLPIAIGYGAGGDARQPLGLAVVGGLVVSQFLTLYITPVIYLYLEQFQSFLRGSKTTPQPQMDEATVGF